MVCGFLLRAQQLGSPRARDAVAPSSERGLPS
jgi:hypothetical protein